MAEINYNGKIYKGNEVKIINGDVYIDGVKQSHHQNDQGNIINVNGDISSLSLYSSNAKINCENIAHIKNFASLVDARNTKIIHTERDVNIEAEWKKNRLIEALIEIKNSPNILAKDLKKYAAYILEGVE